MQCANCHHELETNARFCGQCGAAQLRRRFVLEPEREAFTLKPEEPYELGEDDDRQRWQLPRDAVPASEWRTAHRTFTEPPPEMESGEAGAPQWQEQRWGGFFRRGAALLIDGLIVFMLSLAMALLSYVGYKVGLAAHQRAINWGNIMPLAQLLITASTVMGMSYFVLFHGMEGQTIGKWLLNLRVVGPNNEPVGYRRACLRWFAMLVSAAPLILGFLWVIWSRENRAWHDYLAGTWVIRE